MKRSQQTLFIIFISVFLSAGAMDIQRTCTPKKEIKIPIPAFTSPIVGTPALSQNAFTADYKSQLGFEKNKGQWPQQVEYKADLGSGRRLFLEKNKFTYVIYNPDDLYREHENEHENKNTKENKLKVHAFEMCFLNTSQTCELQGDLINSYHYNYFIGNDPSKWAVDVPVYKTLTYKNLYSGIDLVAYESENNFKYDYILKAGVDAQTIQLKFNGADKLEIKNNNLYILTSVGEMVESVPYAFQVIDGKEIKVACGYKLEKDGKTVSFYLPEGYDKRYELIIDPVLVASTYSGSNASTFGHCATYDLSGNIYTGGRCFGVGYPASTGAIQIAFGGGVDIAISKLNPSGTALLYATYLGGSSTDYPHSLFVNTSNELFVYGSTTSTNYPTSTGCYDNSFNGQSDMIVSKLNATGNVLSGSTYIGGAANDGINNNAIYNYGDTYRGEIVISASGDVFITATTASNDFPVTAGAYDMTYNGLQDAVVLKMNNGLTSLIWATYLGGTLDETGCGIRLNSSGEIYVVGLTKGSGFPTVAGALHATYMGGLYDGYLTRLNSAGTTLINSTFIGTSTKDIAYFVDIDINNEIYVYGISDGVMPITTGVYSNAGSINYLNKLNASLSSIIYATVVGNGTHSNFSPSALLVDVCQNVYLAGWGSNNGYPVTTTATQFTTSGSCFHIMALSQNATSLLYGSFFGLNGDHVDGGTSRFDPTGKVYQAVCSCSAAFPTLPGAFSPTKLSNACDIVVFKIDFQVNCNPLLMNTSICYGAIATINIVNVNTLTNPSFSIQPGGLVSTTPVFTVSPSVTTTYTVYITGTTSFSSIVTNTGISTVAVAPAPVVAPTLTQASCTNSNNAFNLGLSFMPATASSTSYSINWSPTPNSILSPTQTSATGGIAPGVYAATVTTNSGCITSTIFTINPIPSSASFSVAGPFVVTCYNPVVTLNPIPANYVYTWFGNTATLTGSSASFTLGNTGNWVVYGTDPSSGCIGSHTFVISQNVAVPTSTVAPLLQNITCSVTSVITVTALSNPSVNITQYWLAPGGATLTMNTNPAFFPPGLPGTYTHITVNATNGCFVSKTFTVTSNSGFPTFTVSSPQNFTLGCNSTSLAIINILNAQTTPTAGGAVSYTLLGPGPAVSFGTGNSSTYTVSVPGTYTVVTRDNTSLCESKTQISVLQNTLAPDIQVDVPQIRLTCFVPGIVLGGMSNTSNTSFVWSIPGAVGNIQASTLAVNANTAQTTNTLVGNYTLTATNDINTCRSSTVISLEQNLFNPIAQISGDTKITCSTSTLVLTNQSSTGIPPFFTPVLAVVAYSWKGPSPQVEQQYSTTYVAGFPGTYTLIAQDLNNGCFSTATKTIDDLREYPDVEKSEEPFILDCGLNSIPVYATILSSKTGLSYEWTPAAGAITSILNTPTISVNSEGQYMVIITNTLNGCVSSAMLDVINGTLHASFLADQVSGYAPFAVSFTNTSASSSLLTSTNNISSYWNFGNGSSQYSTKQNTVAPVVYNQPGTYKVTLFANKGKCMDSTSVFIQVEIPSDLVIPNIFTPNGDGSNDLFFVKATNLDKINIVIVDRWGHRVYEISSETGNIAWDGKNQYGKDVADGVYLYTLKASGKDGRTYNKQGNISLVR